MNQLTFRDTHALLAAGGYAPAPLGDNGKPLGPFAVQQIAYHKYATNDELPVAVISGVPAPRNEHDPVQNHRSTWLATLTVSVRDDLVSKVDAIIAKYIGAAKCPVRIADDGSTLRVFQLAGDLFSTIGTHLAHDPDFVRVESAAGFAPVNGDWRNGISLMDVFRSELPELDHERAQRLIGELNDLLDAHVPPVEPPAPFVPRPLLEPGQRLLYGNTRAMQELREHGFQPVPVRWGQREAEHDGYSDFMGHWHYNGDVAEHGVGINLKGFALLEFVGRYRADVDEAIRSMGTCLIRTAAGDGCPVYLFRCDQGGASENIYSPNAHVHARRVGLIVLSGTDDKGRAYQWDRDVLTVKASELATFERNDAQRLQRILEPLPLATDYSKASGKRRKTA